MTLCHHCEAPAEIAGVICRACAGAAYHRTMHFGRSRYLLPGESLRDSDHSTDGTPVQVGAVVDSHEIRRYTRRIRLAPDARFFLDAGMFVRPTDAMRDPDGRCTLVDAFATFKVLDETRYSRAIYAAFPPRRCRCKTRASLGRTAEACTDCGLIYDDMEVSVLDLPETGRAVCLCRHVVPVQAIEEGKRYLPADNWLHQVRCVDCGSIWQYEAWAVRHSPYPDLATQDPELIRAALKPTMLNVDLFLLAAENHVWTRTRSAAEATWGTERVAAIDDVVTGARESRDRQAVVAVTEIVRAANDEVRTAAPNQRRAVIAAWLETHRADWPTLAPFFFQPPAQDDPALADFIERATNGYAALRLTDKHPMLTALLTELGKLQLPSESELAEFLRFRD